MFLQRGRSNNPSEDGWNGTSFNDRAAEELSDAFFVPDHQELEEAIYHMGKALR